MKGQDQSSLQPRPTVQNSVPAPYPPLTTAKDTYTRTGLRCKMLPRRGFRIETPSNPLAISIPSSPSSLDHLLLATAVSHLLSLFVTHNVEHSQIVKITSASI
ncbi:hypothetical protein D9613_012907 [Agrocybe pediades]|uniref:Uncharacterized protein n=1 Tax=Agrocybe pediades TaxID=84607 RepID=A0A8H4QRK0_9AGAR|nr:hypothetical protein D9613_012907 [Agrocybe pediades]